MSSKVCFLICPIGAEGSETRKHSDTVFEHILKPVMSEKGYDLIRADKIIQADTITDSIIHHIESDALVIADITEANPNVYFELGYRTALKKHVIQIAANGTKIPFDISIKRTFFYDKNDLTSVDNFKTLLLTLIDNLESSQNALTQQANNTLSNAFVEAFASKFMDKIFFNPEIQSEEVFENVNRLKELGNGKEKSS